MRIWLLTNTPSPYQVEFFRALHASPEMELAVRFMRTTHRGRRPLEGGDPGFPYRRLRGWGWPSWRDEVKLHPGAVTEVLSGRYDFYVLSGHYTSLTFVLCAVFLWMRRKPWAMWLERPWPEDYRPSWATRATVRFPVLRGCRQRLLSRLVRMARGVFCIGTAAADAYRALGIPAEKVHVIPYFCDVSRFTAADESAGRRIRAELSCEDKVVFLFSGSLVQRKGADVLIDAFHRLSRDRRDIALLILGDGPLKASLEGSVSVEYEDRVHFAGQVEQAELPAYFKSADVFVFPSRHDGWGVVINEACGAGLPIISTRATGAARDLVAEGENGFLVDRDDVEGVLERMKGFAEDAEARKIFGQRSLEISRDYTLEKGVARFRAAVQASLGG